MDEPSVEIHGIDNSCSEFLTRDDVFVSYDFTPLNSLDNIDRWTSLTYNEIVFANFLSVRKRATYGNPILPYNTLLYVAHTDISGNKMFVVYGFSYGIHYGTILCHLLRWQYRNDIFSKLLSLLEDISVESLMSNFTNEFTEVFIKLRNFIDRHDMSAEANLYIFPTQISPLFNMFSCDREALIINSPDFVALMIENGISRPATKVTILNAYTLVIEEEGIIIHFSSFGSP
jgi:hypothetical protein